MEPFGDFFPGNPQTLDELLEQIAARWRRSRPRCDSMTPEQRAQLQALAESLFEDMDLRWQVDRLAENLQQAVPGAGWGRRYRFSGSDPMGLADAAAVGAPLGEMDQLEQFLRSASSPGRPGRGRPRPGGRATWATTRPARSTAWPAWPSSSRRPASSSSARAATSSPPWASASIGQQALSDLFSKLAKDRLGGHRNTVRGHRPRARGPDQALRVRRPLQPRHPAHGPQRRARAAGRARRCASTPDDFEISRTEHLTRASTVLMVDLSLSMPMRDNFLAAKKVAIALHTLISTQFPRDFLGLVGFSEVAREIKAEELPEVSWDFVYGTNMQHGLLLGRRMLAHRPGTKQIIMITDGEPTAHLVPEPGRRLRRLLQLPAGARDGAGHAAEVVRCTRAGITINTFMLDANRSLQGFVEQMTKLNRGRAFFTTPETLGDYVLVDFLEHRRTVTLGHPPRRLTVSPSPAPSCAGARRGNRRTCAHTGADAGRHHSTW